MRRVSSPIASKDTCLLNRMVSQMYPSELQLNNTNTSDTEAAFLDLHLSMSNDIVSTKIYDERDDFHFEIVNIPFLDGDVPRSTSYGVYISQFIRFASLKEYQNIKSLLLASGIIMCAEKRITKAWIRPPPPQHTLEKHKCLDFLAVLVRLHRKITKQAFTIWLAAAHQRGAI